MADADPPQGGNNAAGIAAGNNANNAAGNNAAGNNAAGNNAAGNNAAGNNAAGNNGNNGANRADPNNPLAALPHNVLLQLLQTQVDSDMAQASRPKPESRAAKKERQVNEALEDKYKFLVMSDKEWETSRWRLKRDLSEPKKGEIGAIGAHRIGDQLFKALGEMETALRDLWHSPHKREAMESIRGLLEAYEMQRESMFLAWKAVDYGWETVDIVKDMDGKNYMSDEERKKYEAAYKKRKAKEEPEVETKKDDKDGKQPRCYACRGEGHTKYQPVCPKYWETMAALNQKGLQYQANQGGQQYQGNQLQLPYQPQGQVPQGNNSGAGPSGGGNNNNQQGF